MAILSLMWHIAYWAWWLCAVFATLWVALGLVLEIWIIYEGTEQLRREHPGRAFWSYWWAAEIEESMKGGITPRWAAVEHLRYRIVGEVLTAPYEAAYFVALRLIDSFGEYPSSGGN